MALATFGALDSACSVANATLEPDVVDDAGEAFEASRTIHLVSGALQSMQVKDGLVGCLADLGAWQVATTRLSALNLMAFHCT